jgi:hypothetical protein
MKSSGFECPVVLLVHTDVSEEFADAFVKIEIICSQLNFRIEPTLKTIRKLKPL